MKMQYTPANVIQKWILPSISFSATPNILGNQKNSAPNMANSRQLPSPDESVRV
jgi:hypothetical protein